MDGGRYTAWEGGLPREGIWVERRGGAADEDLGRCEDPDVALLDSCVLNEASFTARKPSGEAVPSGEGVSGVCMNLSGKLGE